MSDKEGTQASAEATVEQLINASMIGKPTFGNTAKTEEPIPAEKPKPQRWNEEKASWPQLGDDGQWRDRNRNVFDPQKHRVDASGKPMVSGKGYFKGIPARLQGNPHPVPQPQKPAEEGNQQSAEEPKKDEPAPDEPEPQTTSSYTLDLDDEPEPDPVQMGDQHRLCAKVVCESIYALGMGIGGSSCKPLKEHRESMESAWTEYFRQKGITDVPPWLMVTTATGGYVLHCGMQREAQERLRPWWQRLKEKVVGFVVRRKMRKEG